MAQGGAFGWRNAATDKANVRAAREAIGSENKLMVNAVGGMLAGTRLQVGAEHREGNSTRQGVRAALFRCSGFARIAGGLDLGYATGAPRSASNF
jgi:hypothetical protein